MAYLNRKKSWFVLIITITCAMISLAGCKSEKKKEPFKSDESVILNFIDNNKNKTVDYYASSSYKPSDVLYEPVLAIQRKRWDIAIPLLEQLVKEKNPDAMYWLASISGGSVFSGSKIAKLFEESALLGNPYAALRLDVSSQDCDSYLHGYCNEKWGKYARTILEKRAKDGDVRAEYHLAILNGVPYTNTLNLSLKNADKGYLYPLYKYIFYNIKLTPEIRNELYDFMIRNHFTPVARLMNAKIGFDSLDHSFYSSSLDYLKVSDGVWGSLFEINDKFFESNPDKKFIKDVILSDCISNILINSKQLKGPFDMSDIGDIDDSISYYNSMLEENSLAKISSEEELSIKNEAVKLTNEMKPIIYIDEFYYEP